MKKVLLFTISFLLFSCGAGTNDINVDLGDGYFLEVEGSRSNIGTDYSFKDGIYPNIVSYALNDRYIIVKQKPDNKNLLLLYSDNILSNYLILTHNPTIEKNNHIKKFQDLKIWKDPTNNSQIRELISRYNNVEDRVKILNYISEKALDDPKITTMLSKKINYYIIHKKCETIFGPLSINEFNRKKNDLLIQLEFAK